MHPASFQASPSLREYVPLFPATPPVPLRTLIVVEVCEEVSWWQVEVETH